MTQNRKYAKMALRNINVDEMISYASDVADIVTSLRDKPTKLDYVAAGFKFISETYTHFLAMSAQSYFYTNPDWIKFEKNNSMMRALIRLFDDSGLALTKYSDFDDEEALVVDLPNSAIGWTVRKKTKHWGHDEFGSRQGSVEGPWIKCVEYDRLRSDVSQVFWSKFPSNAVTIRHENTANNDYISRFIEDDKDDDELYITDATQQLGEQLKLFRQKSVPRAVLFHGPPGVGKSTNIKMIIKMMGLRSLRLRVDDIVKIDADEIVSAAELFSPDVLIIDDIDRGADMISMFNGLERFRKSTGIVLMTMNNLEMVPEALLRPGRIDMIIEMHEIDERIVEKYVDRTDPHFDEIKKWPIAFIREYRSMIDVLGEGIIEDTYSKLQQRVTIMLDTIGGRQRNEILASKLAGLIPDY